MHKNSSRRTFQWYHALILWSALLLVCGIIGCFVLYRYLGVYEISRPETQMDTVLESEGADGLFSLALASLHEENYPFEDILNLYTEYYDTYISGNNLSYREEKGSRTEDTAVYAVRAGTEPFCVVTLKAQPGSDLGFGRHYWQLDSVSAESVLAKFDSVEVQINAVSGTEFTLNNKTVGPEYIAETEPMSDGLSNIEKQFNQQPMVNHYVIGPIYGDVVVKDGDGAVVSPEDSSASTISYQIMPQTWTVTITAPADVNVNICGADLNKNDATTLSQGIFEGLDNYTNENSWLTAVYHFDGLHQKPEITASDMNGNLLEPVYTNEEKYYYTYANQDYDEEYITVAQDFFNAYMDYSAKGTHGGAYYIVLNKILSGSELWQYVANSYDAMVWASQTSADYNDITFANFCKVSDICFTCTVSYSADMTATAWAGQYSYHLANAYQLVFVNDGTWKCAAMKDLAA